MEIFRPLLIAALVVTEVAIWQWRMVIAHRGRRSGAMLLGIVGALLQITAITQVVANVHDPLSIGAYAVGVGCGVLFGLVAGERLTPGMVDVTVITSAPDLAARLWRLGWPAVAQPGHGEDGPVTFVSVAIERRDEAHLRRVVRDLDPAARWSSTELRIGSAARRRAPAAASAAQLAPVPAAHRVDRGIASRRRLVQRQRAVGCPEAQRVRQRALAGAEPGRVGVQVEQPH